MGTETEEAMQECMPQPSSSSFPKIKVQLLPSTQQLPDTTDSTADLLLDALPAMDASWGLDIESPLVALTPRNENVAPTKLQPDMVCKQPSGLGLELITDGSFLQDLEFLAHELV